MHSHLFICRYDQQLVICRDLEQQLETMKESELKQLQNKDSISVQRAEIENLLRNKDLSDRQQELLGKKSALSDRGGVVLLLAFAPPLCALARVCVVCARA